TYAMTHRCASPIHGKTEIIMTDDIDSYVERINDYVNEGNDAHVWAHGKYEDAVAICMTELEIQKMKLQVRRDELKNERIGMLQRGREESRRLRSIDQCTSSFG